MKLTPKVTWRIEIIRNYFQSEFEGVCRTILEKFNKETIVQICEINPTTPKTTKLRMDYNLYEAHKFKAMCTRSTHSLKLGVFGRVLEVR